MANETFRPSYGKLVLGIGVVLVGIVLTLDQFHLVRAENILSYWPVLLIAVGLAKIRIFRFWESFFGSALVVVGTLYLLDTLDLLTFSIGKLWPVVLVIIGGRIAAGALHRWPGPNVTNAASVSGIAVFGGFHRRLSSTEFKDGQLTAFCGGFDIDLRDADIAGEEAVIDVFAMCGGGVIRVPMTWNVIVKVLPLFGGTDDKTSHAAPQPGVTQKRLVVTGTALMGGLEIRN